MKLNLTIRTKVLAGFSLLLALSAVFAVVATWQVSTFQRLQELTETKFSIISQAENSVWELRSGFPLYMTSPDPKRRQSIKDNNPKHIRDVQQGLRAYSELPNLTEEEAEKLKQTIVSLEDYVSKQPALFGLFDDGKLDEAQEIRAKWTTPGAIATVKGITDLRKLAQQNNETTIDQIHMKANRWMGFTGLLLALFGIGIAMYVYRGISRPLKNLQDTVARVRAGAELKEIRGMNSSQDELGAIWHTVHGLLAERRDAQLKAESENDRLNQSVISILESVHQLSQKDLTVRAPVTQDVIGTVSDSINALTDETSRVLQGVSLIAGSVALASDKVRSQAEMVSKTAEDERSSVGKMIESLTHATQTMNQVAALAEQTNNSANKVTTVTQAALEAVNGTVKGMESIRETIAETEKRIKRLGERSQEISGIVNLINTISERTHVLALNASMQAAVAGEAGRGFAVVAEEVQRLAESSRTATQQISTLVNNIQLETNETISTVNRTIGQVVQGSEQAQKAGDQMRMTQQITGELVAQVKRIADVSEQQREMSTNLLTSVQNIGKSTERTADQISAQNRETESLLQSARRLVESVNVFKLPKMA